MKLDAFARGLVDKVWGDNSRRVGRNALNCGGIEVNDGVSDVSVGSKSHRNEQVVRRDTAGPLDYDILVSERLDGFGEGERPGDAYGSDEEGQGGQAAKA